MKSIGAAIYGCLIASLGFGFYLATKPFIRCILGSTYDLRRLLVSLGLLVLGLSLLVSGAMIMQKNRSLTLAWSAKTVSVLLSTGVATAVGTALTLPMALESVFCLLALIAR